MLVLGAAGGGRPGNLNAIVGHLPGVGIRLAFTVQPNAENTGTPINPAIQVSIRDAFGNTATTATNTITLSKLTGVGNLGGTLSVAASAGVATFNNVTLSAADTYTLTCTATGLTPDTSSSFVISVGAGEDPTVPTFNPAIHTSFFLWDADSFANAAAMIGDADFVQEQRGTLALDTTNGPTGGKCGRVDWATLGCGNDGDVQLHYDFGTVPRTVILLTYSFKTTVGYSLACPSGPDQKLLIIGPTSSTCPRTVFGISGSGETFPINCPDAAPFDDLFCTGTTWYINQDFAQGTSHGGQAFGSYRDGVRHGAPDLDDCFDGNWHEQVVRITLESVIDSGEGRVEHWTRPWGGTWRKTMNHLGDVPGNDAFQKVHTGTSQKGEHIEIGVPTLNGGTSLSNAKFYFQYNRIYYVT